MAACCRLFTVPPGLIFEHPPTLPLAGASIPAGPIAGWEAYATGFFADSRTVFGPFAPVISRRYGQPCIEVRVDPRGPAFYWYIDGGGDGPAWRPRRPCWYQSGATLRFVAKREEATP
jgi:hypothetical protein